MSKWERVKIDEVCEKKIQTLKSSEDFLIEYVDISSVDNQEKKITSYQTIRSKEAPSRAKQVLRKNDILVSTVRPNLNAVALNLIDSENIVVGSTGYCILRCNERIDTNYLFNFCKSKTFINGLVKVAKGASYPAVSNTDVIHSMISLPPLEIQKRIAKTLDTAAELLTMRKQQFAELDNLIKSIFYDMFGDPVLNNKVWEVKLLGALIKEIKYGTSTPPIFSESGYCFIRATNIKFGRIIESDMKFISESEANKIKKCKLRAGDLILVRSGVNTGDTCVITEKYTNQYAGYDLIITVNQLELNPFYLNELINTVYMERVIKPLTRRAAQPHLNAEQTKNLPIIVPPLQLQTQFANIVTQIEEQKAIVKQAIDETQHLFDSLMSEYFE